ncbi:MAG: hypothetical protein J0M17_09095 [Planctomycetes bacterium]|jgi:hypothetical protein|nr:hypothetical protein [Planctomycetota bacterium]
MRFTLTDRDLDLLETLTMRVRMLAMIQWAQLGWPLGRNLKTAQRRLRQLTDTGLIETHVVNAHPLLPAEQPLAEWQPGNCDHDAKKISEQARRRWNAAAQPMTVCVASPLAAGLFGSTARGLPAVEHRDHDLRLASTYVYYRQHQPQAALMWLGNHALPKAGYRLKNPDALLRDPCGRTLRVIHSAGHYSHEQVESFHKYCVEHDLPYELW